MTDSTQLKQHQQDSFEGRILVIDGDSISYMIGWHHREHTDEQIVKNALRSWMSDLILLTAGTHIIGFLGNKNAEKIPTFREVTYKVKPYKGKRLEKPDWLRFWEPVINNILIDTYNFIRVPHWAEADDYVALSSYQLTQLGKEHLICSPDKDLKQIAGTHYNYKKAPEDAVQHISAEQANYNWAIQMLMGDDTDNIAGIPGMGEKKAKDYLKGCDPEMLVNKVKLRYETHFGPYHGPLIYEETRAAVSMCIPGTPIYNHHPPSFQVMDNLKQVVDL